MFDSSAIHGFQCSSSSFATLSTDMMVLSELFLMLRTSLLPKSPAELKATSDSEDKKHRLLRDLRIQQQLESVLLSWLDEYVPYLEIVQIFTVKGGFMQHSLVQMSGC